MKALIPSLLLLYSCTKYAALEKNAMGLTLSPVQMEFHHLKEIEWNVGQKKEETITQSFSFMIEMPKVKKEDLEVLTSQKGIDAWILRIIVRHGSEEQDLGSLYALFKPRQIARGVEAGAASNVSLKVYYAAAYASERFREFKCPAFSHNKRITSMKFGGENSEFSLSVGQEFPYSERSHLVELTPSSFNGGNDLSGEYFIEIAPYDSKKKVIHSSFKRLPMSVVVEREESVRIKSCDGIHPEIKN